MSNACETEQRVLLIGSQRVCMGGNQRDFGRQQRQKKKERKREEMETSDSWKHVSIPVLFEDEKRIWVKTQETEDVVETFICEEYGMKSWFKKASAVAVEKTVYHLLDDQPWIDEVRWNKP